MRRLLVALSVLTVVPVPATPSSGELAGSVPFFPVVGALIGCLLALVDFLLHPFLCPRVVAALVLTVSWLLTGGMHLDGLADTADGLAARAPRQKVLEVMRDPRVGAVGAATIFLLLLIKWACLEALSPSLRMPALLLMPVIGRQAMVITMPRYRYPRAEPGLASPFAGKVSPAASLVALGITLLLVAVVSSLEDHSALQWLLAAVAGLGSSQLFAAWVAHRLGGMTGDAYGAVCEVAEALFLLGASIVRA